MSTLNYISLSGLRSEEVRAEIIANNIANSQTAGHKASSLFSKSLEQIQPTKESITLPRDYSSFLDQSMGPLMHTGNPYDVAITRKEGYFVVSRDGQDHVTRNGQFTLNSDRELITHMNDPVQSAGGGAIQIPEGTSEFSVLDDGSLATENGVFAKLRLVDFENPQDIQAKGDGLFTSEQEVIELTDFQVKGGMIEGSNINVAHELTETITTQRKYEIYVNVLKASDDLETNFIQSVLA